jgi:hypothetical protein
MIKQLQQEDFSHQQQIQMDVDPRELQEPTVRQQFTENIMPLQH